MNVRNVIPLTLLSSALWIRAAQDPQLRIWAQDILLHDAEPDRERYFDTRMRAQLVLGDYAAALTTADSLRSIRSHQPRSLPPIASFPYEVFALAKLLGSTDSGFAQRAATVDDRTSAVAMSYTIGASAARIKGAYDETLARIRTQDSVPMADKVAAVRLAASAAVFALLEPNTARLIAADDARRYIINRDVRVPTPQGGAVCALVYRPRTATARLPALLNFTIYASDQNTFEARRTASNGYVGVEGLTRGKGCSPNHAVSHEYDGIDAAALIDWIAAQPWSDGRVGMYGGSYEGMTQWAAAKHMPRALKAMMPSVTHAPGIDFPMDGNIFVTYAYPWPFYTTNVKGLDSGTYADTARWTSMMRKWYTSGRRYRDLPDIDGTPNPAFERWLAHPSYDAYWKSMVAAGSDFARITIPVLTTTGYYDGGQMGALWFFREHTKYLPHAEHYLVIGPYDHVGGQRGNIDPMGRRAWSNVQGYELDPVADLDIGALRYAWFDYVFRGAPKPAILQDRVNFEVMGANIWKHAPSLAAMVDSTITIRLAQTVEQRVDLSDRSDVDKWGSTGDLLDPSSSGRALIDTTFNVANAITFASEPFERTLDVSGLFSGRLSFRTNKKDFDFTVSVFELDPQGKYMQLSYHWQRASYTNDRTRRTLLVPGRTTTLSFTNNRLTSRRVQRGNRLVVVIAIAKNPSQQINYGTGRVVADESIADAGAPLQITWLPGTQLQVRASADVGSRSSDRR
jgi:uncharacterized protein